MGRHDLPAAVPTRRDPDVVLMQIQSDAMAPIFTTGDLVEVDRRVEKFCGDHVYVFTLEGQPYVNALQRLEDGSLLVIYSNQHYESFTISPEDQFKLTIHGRVVKAWVGRSPAWVERD